MLSPTLDLLAEAEDPAFAVAMSQRILFFNRSAERILGYRAEEVLGKWYCPTFAGLSEEEARVCAPNCPDIVAARQGRAPPTHTALVRTREGTARWISMTHVTLVTNKRQPEALVHILHDVTEEVESKRLIRRLSGLLCRTGVVPELLGISPQLGPEGGEGLTPRELEVVNLLADGLGTKEIAEKLMVSPVTARNHIQRVLSKLGVHTRLELVAHATRRPNPYM